MLRSVGKFAKDRKGAFALQFALMAIPMTVCTGLAIDGGRAYLARYELGAALDAAALALGSVSDPTADLNVIAHKFVNANFQGKHSDPIVLEVTDVGDKEETLILKGKVTINTYFMPLVGQPTVTVAAESEVKRGGNNVEVTLALDVTESMDGTRMSTLRVAAKNLIDTVVSDLQTPFYSRIAIVPWANNVYLGNDASLANEVRGTPIGLQGIDQMTWRDGSAHSISEATWRTGASATITVAERIGSSGNRKHRITTSAAHGFVNGDIIGIKGVNNGFTGINDKRYKVSDVTSTTFLLKEYNSDSYASASGYSGTPGSAGTVSKCITPTCEVEVTSNSHGLQADDYVYVTGVSGMTGINNNATTGWTWRVKEAASDTSNKFILANSNGPSYVDYSSSSSDEVQKCFNSTCAVKVAFDDPHGRLNGDHVWLQDATGLTPSINRTGTNTWVVAGRTDYNFLLQGSIGPSYTSFSYNTETGKMQCLQSGCSTFRFTNMDGDVVYRAVTNCVSERVGSHLYDDETPDTAPVGKVYYGGGSSQYTNCETSTSTNWPGGRNSIVPLTANKTTLKSKIDDMVVTGSTGGHMGAAWGWYMLAPDWGYLWPNAENKPGAYDKSDLKKVLVLMTDGEFNTAHCHGVVANNSGVGSSAYRIQSDDRSADCDSENGASISQAQALCTAMKANDKKIIVYTIGFEITAGGAADNFLKACATDLDHYRLASNSDALKKAFDEIAASISMLRIAR